MSARNAKCEQSAAGMSTVIHLIVQHDGWCPMAYGKGSCCCKPVPKAVSSDDFAAIVRRGPSNRAQRRAEARRGSRQGGQL